jgi:hypothetical protein
VAGEARKDLVVGCKYLRSMAFIAGGPKAGRRTSGIISSVGIGTGTSVRGHVCHGCVRCLAIIIHDSVVMKLLLTRLNCVIAELANAYGILLPFVY